MMRHHRRSAFTFVEAMVGGSIFLVMITALIYTRMGARRTEQVSTLYINLMENVALAMHQLRIDLRQLAIVPGKPVVPYSILIQDDADAVRRALRVRRSWAVMIAGGLVGSAFTHVDYQLIRSAPRSDRYHLVRTERTASGENLPGRKAPSDKKVFRAFTIKNAFFNYLEDPKNIDVRVLHVVLEIASDSGDLPGWGPFREKTMVLSHVLHILRPEAPYSDPIVDPVFPRFAQPLSFPGSSGPLENPPGNVLAPVIRGGLEPLSSIPPL